jgi:hypothetical protein
VQLQWTLTYPEQVVADCAIGLAVAGVPPFLGQLPLQRARHCPALEIQLRAPKDDWLGPATPHKLRGLLAGTACT